MEQLLFGLLSSSGPVVGLALVGCLVFLWREMRSIRTELLALLKAQERRLGRVEDKIFPTSPDAKA